MMPNFRFCFLLGSAILGLPAGTTALAQNEPQADLATCRGAARNKNADPAILACTRLLNIEIRESAHRRAVALTFRALAWKAKGDSKRAMTDLTEAINLDSGFAPAYEARADILRDGEQCERALPDYNQAARIAPDRATMLIGRAICLNDRKNDAEAVADLDRVIKLDADNAGGLALLAWSMKARINVTKGNLDEALANFASAIRLDGKRAGLYLERALLFAGKGEEERALADYDRVIELGEKRYASAAWSAKAALHARKERLDAALSAYGEAIRIDPAHAAAYLSRATIRNRKGDRAGALADLDAAIAGNPTVPTLYKARADFHRAQRNYTNALGDYNQAIALQPDFVLAYGDRALLRYYMGDFAKSADDFRQVNDRQANAYSLLFQFLTAARAGNGKAAEEFGKAIGTLKPADWPYPIIEVFLGKKTAETLQKEATKPAERCEAHFYVGALQLTRDLKDQAVKELRAAVETCPEDFIESRAADEDLKRLN